jgi:hypothetical protein
MPPGLKELSKDGENGLARGGFAAKDAVTVPVFNPSTMIIPPVLEVVLVKVTYALVLDQFIAPPVRT